MLQFSAKTDYGLLFMTSLAQHAGQGPISLKRIALRRRLPYRFLTQIVLLLRQAGLVSAKEGVHGGYELSRSPKKITVGEVIRALEGDLHLVRCLEEQRTCRCDTVCVLPPLWQRVQGQLNRTFDSLTLTDLLETPKKRIRL